jgi:geranylgeranyl diphosphate synthase type II
MTQASVAMQCSDPVLDSTGLSTPAQGIDDLREALEVHLMAGLPVPRHANDAVPVAMREAALSPGKRVRPLLLLATGRALGANVRELLDAACAIELVHAASLVLDDLPCMDDARQRRGRPALHVQFGEDVAALVVVALVSRAYGLLVRSDRSGSVAGARMVAVLSEAVGHNGLVDGQMRDLRSHLATVTADDAARVNRLKTGSLFRAAFEMACIASGASGAVNKRLGRCASDIGEAFQLLDDLKDIGELPCVGKDTNQDQGKRTWLRLIGTDRAKQQLFQQMGRIRAGLTAVFPHDDAVLRILHEACGLRLRTQEIVSADGPDARADCPSW